MLQPRYQREKEEKKEREMELVHHVRSGDVARPSSMFPASSVPFLPYDDCDDITTTATAIATTVPEESISLSLSLFLSFFFFSLSRLCRIGPFLWDAARWARTHGRKMDPFAFLPFIFLSRVLLSELRDLG